MGLGDQPEEPAIAIESGVERAIAEVGPQRVAEDELGVRALEQQKIGQAVLAAGTNHEIRVGEVTGRETIANAALVDVFRGDEPSLRMNRDLANGADHVLATAVGDGEGQCHAGTGSRGRHHWRG